MSDIALDYDFTVVRDAVYARAGVYLWLDRVASFGHHRVIGQYVCSPGKTSAFPENENR